MRERRRIREHACARVTLNERMRAGQGVCACVCSLVMVLSALICAGGGGKPYCRQDANMWVSAQVSLDFQDSIYRIVSHPCPSSLSRRPSFAREVGANLGVDKRCVYVRAFVGEWVIACAVPWLVSESASACKRACTSAPACEHSM